MQRTATNHSPACGLLGLALGLTFGLAFPMAVQANDWPQWRGPDGNGLATSAPKLVRSLPEEGLTPAWQSEAIPSGRSGGWGSPVAADGKVYLFVHSRNGKDGVQVPPAKFPWLAPDKRGHLNDEEYAEYEKNRRIEDFERGKLSNFQETVYCFDAQTGKTLWKNQRPSVYTRFVQSGSPAVVDGRLYIMAPGRKARCVDAADGKDLWETQLPGDFHDEFIMSSFAVADGVAAVLAGHLFGLDAKTGDVRWQGDPKTTKGTHSSPVMWRSSAGPLFVANVAGKETICVRPADGKELWRVESEANQSTPVLAGDRMVTLGDSRKKGLRCFRITPESAEEEWVYTGAADKGASPVVVGQFVYVQGEQRLACVSLEDGKAQWQTLLEVAKPQYTSLAAADGLVFYACEGVLGFSASPDEYQPVLSAKIDKDGLMATEAYFKKTLDLAKVQADQGQQQALKLYQQRVGGHGPLECSSPAIFGGKLLVRLKDRIACYDLTAK